MRLAGKVALISGGARGMGAVEARLFVREGARVVIGDVLEADGRQVEAEICATGGEAVFVPLDVTSEADWQRAVATAVSRFGRLDILVNNAGVGGPGRLEDTTAEEWDRVMDINAKGVFLGTKAAIPAMRRAGGGSIINISSICGIVGSFANAAYHASKGAVRIFSKSAAIQYAKDQIRVNSIHPGFVDTPMARPGLIGNESGKARMDATPMGRFGKPIDIANGCLYLASDDSSWVTGSELVIDGGMTAN